MAKQTIYAIPENVMSGVELEVKMTGALEMVAEAQPASESDGGPNEMCQAGISAAAETLQEYVVDVLDGIQDQEVARAIYIELGERLADIGASAAPLPRGGKSHGIAFSV